jgi:hypothetical protein
MTLIPVEPKIRLEKNPESPVHRFWKEAVVFQYLQVTASHLSKETEESYEIELNGLLLDYIQYSTF